MSDERSPHSSAFNLREALGVVAFPDTPEQRDQAWNEITREFASLTRTQEQLEALQRTVEHYVEADARYQRRIDTQPLKAALPNPVVTGDGTGEALDPLIEGFSAPRVSNPARNPDA